MTDTGRFAGKKFHVTLKDEGEGFLLNLHLKTVLQECQPRFSGLKAIMNK
jgi:hypothetical protein